MASCGDDSSGSQRELLSNLTAAHSIGHRAPGRSSQAPGRSSQAARSRQSLRCSTPLLTVPDTSNALQLQLVAICSTRSSPDGRGEAWPGVPTSLPAACVAECGASTHQTITPASQRSMDGEADVKGHAPGRGGGGGGGRGGARPATGSAAVLDKASELGTHRILGCCFTVQMLPTGSSLLGQGAAEGRTARGLGCLPDGGRVPVPPCATMHRCGSFGSRRARTRTTWRRGSRRWRSSGACPSTMTPGAPSRRPWRRSRPRWVRAAGLGPGPEGGRFGVQGCWSRGTRDGRPPGQRVSWRRGGGTLSDEGWRLPVAPSPCACRSAWLAQTHMVMMQLRPRRH